LKVKLPPERSIRVGAGLILFAYAGNHLASHATGLFLLDAIQAVGHDILMRPWRTLVGLSLLLAAFLVHIGLGLTALFRRRHLRMPALEAVQLALGLLIPFLLIPHVSDARLAVLLEGFEDSYFRVLYTFWIADPAVNLPRQLALLLAVWIHGCIGVHMWLRFRPWYRRRLPAFATVAIALPALAVLGVINAGWNTVLRAAVEPQFAAAYAPTPPGTSAADAAAALAVTEGRLLFAYAAIVAAVFVLRALRNWVERRAGGIRIEYRGGPHITVPRGLSILEASRLVGVPHASVCGGRARCSTCRVRVTHGEDRLAPPVAPEVTTLANIRAPAAVRLACQVRPTADVAVIPLVPASRPLDGLRVNLVEGRELLVTALYVDLRDSTRLAAGRLPYDAVFVIDRYIQAATAAIIGCGGHVTSVAGDGVMSVFGIDANAASGARNALRAVSEMWRSIDQVSGELKAELGSPLRFGVGVHSGLSVVGAVGLPDHATVQFLGDTGNVAARLEKLTTEMACTAIISAATLAAAQLTRPDWRAAEVEIRGHDAGKLPVHLICRREEMVPHEKEGPHRSVV
jgi:adenylate cyclase